MVIFDRERCIDVCLQNDNPYVRMAVEDLLRDFARVSDGFSAKPNFVDQETEGCLVITANVTDGDPLEDESFTIDCDGKVIKISANGYLGTVWGIYTFSEKILGVDPCYLFNDLPTEKRSAISVGTFHWDEKPEKKGFRGVFINDEDLLTGWKTGGGIRRMDYPFYGVTVAESVIDRVVETVLRLKLNLVIPASFLDIDNPPEKALADCVAKRGIFLSQHHLEPLGLSHFTFENYCKKFEKDGQYSYIHNPETLIDGWKYYAEKWAKYDNVVWQVGLRGKADRPVWEEDTPTEEELKTYARYISDAIKKQREIVFQATQGRAKYFSTTLWMEGSTLMQKGVLELDDDVILVFADNGPNQMFGGDYDRVSRRTDGKYGIYYHVQYYDIGPHIAPQTGLAKLTYNVAKAKEKGDDDYFILNVSNVREFDFEIKAYAQMLWNFTAFSTEKYLDEYAAIYGKDAETAKKLVEKYFDEMPFLPTEDLQYVHANYFNYNYDEVSPNVKNFVLKDGLILWRGSDLVHYFRGELPTALFGKMYTELKRVLPVYENLAKEFSALESRATERVAGHVRCKWGLYAETLAHIYRWYVTVYEAKLCYDRGESEEMQALLQDACKTLETYLELRKCAEYGEFENWYRGDLKMNIKHKLDVTRRLLGWN